MNALLPLTNVNVVCKPGEIKVIGFDDLKKGLLEHLEKYKVLISEDQLKEAKKEAADLNKLAKAIDDKRKQIKKKYEKPLKEFERQMKELVEQVKNARSYIDNQIKKYENEKKEEIKKVIQEYIEDLYELNQIPREFRTIDADRYVKLTAISKGGKITKATASQIEADVKEILLEIQKKKEEELQKQLEVERIKKEAIEEYVGKKEVAKNAGEVKEEQPKQTNGKIVYQIVFEVKADANIDKNVLYGKVKELICQGKIKPKIKEAE